MQLTGLHHVTAVTGNTANNVEFFTHVLGLRLVKKTVNQDDISAYHLYYADRRGNPGTDVTFFDWPHIGRNVAGVGTIGTIALRVSGTEALDWWAQHLAENGVEIQKRGEYAGREGIFFSSPEGMSLALLDDGNAPTINQYWEQGSIPQHVAIRGLDAASVIVARLESLAAVLTQVLGFKQTREYDLNDTDRLVVFETGAGGPGSEVYVEVRPNGMEGNLGIGGVHHIAFRTPNPEEHRLWRARIAEVGLGVTPVIDRFYFKSIYFRVPGGALFEIATDGPGFDTDEDIEHLGEKLALPPFLEGQRAEIEKNLHPLSDNL